MASPTHAGNVHHRDNEGKRITFFTPPCPIKAKTVPPTKTAFRFPPENPVGEPLSVTGTFQVTDQTGSTVLLLAPTLAADQNGFSFARTVKTIQHATGTVTFDKGCTKTDPYGSNNCHWAWDESITEARQGALQENITAGKLIVDLKINSTPLQFSCPICGAPCTVQIPKELARSHWNRVWVLAISMFGHRAPYYWWYDDQK